MMRKPGGEAWQQSSRYDYTLPEGLIASEPIEPRDAARLMVVDRQDGTITHARFQELFDYLPKETAVLYNNTKVIKARLLGRKPSGGKAELFLNRPLPGNTFAALIRGRVKPGSRILFSDGLEAQVLQLRPDGSRIVSFYADNPQPLDFNTLQTFLQRQGHVPLPPYIRREARPEDNRNYQSVFAAHAGAVAAPTASLHFTREQFTAMQKRFATAPVTLHVGAGTFKPVEADNITDHVMHNEWYDIPDAAAALIASPAPLLAVGTTVTRTVEYFVRTARRSGECNLFLHPGNPPRRINHLLTNFHLPKSTLIMLVAAFLGIEATMHAYKAAIEAEYRFYSYGDAMLIL